MEFIGAYAFELSLSVVRCAAGRLVVSRSAFLIRFAFCDLRFVFCVLCFSCVLCFFFFFSSFVFVFRLSRFVFRLSSFVDMPERGLEPRTWRL